MKKPPKAEPHHDHAVQFYRDDAALIATLRRFVREGLNASQPVIVIATPEHRFELSSMLMQDGAGSHFEQQGSLWMLDARETLESFMVDGMPDPQQFQRVIGGLLDMARVTRTGSVRAYGEMVDLLWKEGKPEAAIRLEVMWNGLAATQQFMLLCGYSIGSFYKETTGFDIGDVCCQHARVLPA